MDAAKPRVLAFSPIGVDACFSQLYLYALNQASGNVGDAKPPSAAESKRVRFANKLPRGVVVAAAGNGADVLALQSVLDTAGVGVRIPPDLERDALIGVSSVVYSFAWPYSMLWHGKETEGRFFLNGNENHSFAAKIHRKEFDAAVVYVERADDYDVSVAMVGMPDNLPRALRNAKDNDDLMAALTDMHADIVNNRDADQDPPPLGKLTLATIDDVSGFNLRSVVGRSLPGGVAVTQAMHACRLYMNKDGGGVRAGTAMISKGLSMDARTPVNIDFCAFRNGYLVAIEMTRRNVADRAPATLVLAWVNVPAKIAAQ